MKKFLILILLQILYFSISQDNDRLVFLTTHFRHGARAPQFIDETGKDTLQEFWTNPGELIWYWSKNALFIRPQKQIKIYQKSTILIRIIRSS